MATDRMHGVTALEFTEGIRPISDIATNIIGIIATADDADPTAFPLDVPVLCTSAYAALKKAGVKGTLAKALDGIADQADARVIVVRVKSADNAAEQTAAVIGSAEGGNYTGLQALRNSSAILGYTPKIIGAPELDTQAVATELAAIAQALNAFAYVAAGGAESLSEVKSYAENFGQRELMLVENEFMVFDPVTKKQTTGATIARILGARAALDERIGWHKSISNTEINGVVALKHPRIFGLLNKNSDANLLNNANVTTLIRENGFRVWGNRTRSSDPAYAFEVATRSAQIVKETIASAFLWAIDKPMHPSLLRDIAFGVNAKLAEYVNKGFLLGARVYIDKSQNGGARIQNGIFRFDYEFTPVPPLENIEFAQHVTDSFIVNLVDKTIAFASELKPTTV